jgi:hypothetical protein
MTRKIERVLASYFAESVNQERQLDTPPQCLKEMVGFLFFCTFFFFFFDFNGMCWPLFDVWIFCNPSHPLYHGANSDNNTHYQGPFSHTNRQPNI